MHRKVTAKVLCAVAYAVHIQEQHAGINVILRCCAHGISCLQIVICADFQQIQIFIVPLQIKFHIQIIRSANVAPDISVIGDFLSRCGHVDLICLGPFSFTNATVNSHLGLPLNSLIYGTGIIAGCLGILRIQVHKGVGIYHLILNTRVFSLQNFQSLANISSACFYGPISKKLSIKLNVTSNGTCGRLPLRIRSHIRNVIHLGERSCLITVLNTVIAVGADHTVRSDLAVCLPYGFRTAADCAFDQESTDVQIEPLIGRHIMRYPFIEIVLQTFGNILTLQEHGIQIASSIIAGDKIIRCSRSFIQHIVHLGNTVS